MYNRIELPRVISCEGLDGSGKSTVAQHVAEKMGGRYFYCTEDNPIADYREDFDKLSPLARFSYYFALSYFNYRRVEELKKKNKLILCDRTVVSTIVYHRELGVPEKWIQLIPKEWLSQFDAMFYFSVGEEERQRRLSTRAASSGKLSFSDRLSPEFNRKVDTSYSLVLPDRTIIVKTDNKSIETVTAEVIRLLPLAA